MVESVMESVMRRSGSVRVSPGRAIARISVIAVAAALAAALAFLLVLPQARSGAMRTRPRGEGRLLHIERLRLPSTGLE